MKTCTKCGIEKNIVDFYNHIQSRDGLSSWCKSCMKQLSQHNSIGVKSHIEPRASSSAIARQLLAEHCIPSCPGVGMGNRYVDLMAWACVPIEAKMSKEFGSNNFIWTFTPGQMGKLQGFVMFIAKTESGDRCFIVPCDSSLFSERKLSQGASSLSTTINSRDKRSNWCKLAPYEDSYYLINNARDDWVNKSYNHL